MAPIVHTIARNRIQFPSEEPWQRRRFSDIHSEPELLRDICSEMDDGDVFYDVGANLGWHTIIAHEAASDVTVVAFEPHPVTFERLQIITDWYDMDAKIYDYALFSENREIEFSSSPGSFARIDPTEGETMILQAVTAEEIIRRDGIPAPDIVKIDAEGAGFEVLEGLSLNMKISPPRIIYFEYHAKMEAFGADWDDLLAFFNSSGYDIKILDPDKDILKATQIH